MPLSVTVNENETIIITRLGEHHETVSEAGRVILAPLIDRVHRYDTSRQRNGETLEVVAKDNETVRIEFEAKYQLEDAERAFNEVSDVEEATKRLLETKVRAVAADQQVDRFSPSAVQQDVESEVAEPLSNWGVSIHSVKISDVQRV